MIDDVVITGDAGGFGFADSGQSLPHNWVLGAIVADIDQDGDLDAFVDNQAYLNDGSANFTADPRGTVPGVPATAKRIPGDIDNDGDLDMVDFTFFGSNLNAGSGSFVTGNTFTLAGTNGGDVGLVDMDGDGDLDVHLADHALEVARLGLLGPLLVLLERRGRHHVQRWSCSSWLVHLFSLLPPSL